MAPSRVQLWSCGGGRQSAGIAALIVQNRLPKPDHVAMVALEWERRETFAYVNAHVRPALRSLGVPFTYVSRKKYSRPGLFWEAEDGGESLLLPAHTNQSGEPSKLPELCSGKWKRDSMMRWADEQPGWKSCGVDVWLGISWDEKQRRRGQRKQWMRPVYPLLDWFPKCMGLAACLDAVASVGWPPPPRSRCYHCPNQKDAEWAELTPAEWDQACRTDEFIRTKDPHAYLHESLIPLRQVVLKPAESYGFFSGGCTSGMCL